MKKTLTALLLALLILTGCGPKAPAETNQTGQTTDPAPSTEPEVTWQTFPADRQLLAKQYFVYSCETGEFLVSAEAPETRIYPASVTKLFTAYVALPYLNAAKTVTAGDVLNMVAAGSSVAEIKKGDSLTVEQLVAGMLLPSGNDAAYILAEAAGRAMHGEKAKEISTETAVKRFVEEMNAQAKLLGMTGTNFANPDGIHSDNHYTTYKDLAILGTLVQGDPIIRKYASTANMTVTLSSGSVTWKNTNELVNPNSQYYCAYATGLKTGQTPMAGSCLLTSFEYRGQTLLVGVFGCPQPEDRFPDTLQLFTQAVKPRTEAPGVS